MQERRCMRRFILKLHCLICVVEPDLPESDNVLRMQTRNISADGAYLSTESPLPEGTRMNIEIIVRRSMEDRNELAGCCVSVRGWVVRTNTMGMAVKFDGQYQILRITTLIAQCRDKARWVEMLSQNSEDVDASSRPMKSRINLDTMQQILIPEAENGTRAVPAN